MKYSNKLKNFLWTRFLLWGFFSGGDFTMLLKHPSQWSRVRFFDFNTLWLIRSEACNEHLFPFFFPGIDDDRATKNEANLSSRIRRATWGNNSQTIQPSATTYQKADSLPEVLWKRHFVDKGDDYSLEQLNGTQMSQKFCLITGLIDISLFYGCRQLWFLCPKLYIHIHLYS